MNNKNKSSVILAVGALMLSLSFIAAGATMTFAQGAFPTSDAPVSIGGSSALTDPTSVGATPAPTAPSITSSQTVPGSGLSSSGYCTNVSGTILASGSKLSDVIKFFTCFIQNSIIPLLFMLALAVFIWGMVKFIMAQQSAEKEDGKQFMLWGVIALAVMFSVWGLVNIFQQTFQVKNAIPQLTVPSSN